MVVHRRGALVDIAKIAARQPLPTSPRVRLIANSATLIQQMLHTVQGVGLLTDREPVVLPAEAAPEDFAAAVRDALATEGCGSIVCAVVSVYQTGTGRTRTALEELAATAEKPVISVLLDFEATGYEFGDEPDPVGGLPIFDTAVDAIHALSALSAYAHWLDRDPGAVPLLENVDPAAARVVVNKALGSGQLSRELTTEETVELLATHGIEVVPRYPVGSLEEAVRTADRLGWNVVLKATARAVRGRPDLASVHRNIDDPEEMAEAWNDLCRLVTLLGLDDDPTLTVAQPVVQKMADPGVALVITSREDAAFGPIISLGLDGIASELLGDVAYRVPPLTTVDASVMVRDLKASETLFGRHGTPPVDVPGVEDLLHRVAQLADAVPQLASVVLQPCIATRRGVVVLGARVVLAPTADQRDPLARTL
jgi:hypothetical protein